MSTLYTIPLHDTFERKVSNFADQVYALRPHDHLTRLLKTLLGDAGVGQLYKSATIARLAETLGGTQFSELDFFFGEMLGFPRLPTEKYDSDPFNEALTEEDWRKIEYRDSQYRERISLFLQSINRGGTNEGLSMAAEAACGFPCSVIETFRVDQDLSEDYYTPRLSNQREIVITPHTGGEALDESLVRCIYHVINRLKPVNVIVTVDAEGGFESRVPVEPTHVASPSEYFEYREWVTGVDVPIPPNGTDDVDFVVDGVEVEAPTLAHMTTMENSWNQNYSVMTVESEILEVGSGTRTPQFPATSSAQRSWGPWRPVTLADSPDNYPGGKFQGDPSHYDKDANYIYSWESQSQYVAWLTAAVESQGGEISDIQYRLPISQSPVSSEQSVPFDSLTSTSELVRSSYYIR